VERTLWKIVQRMAMPKGLLRSKPAGALRLVLRLPIYLYRLRLGWLLGHQFLLLLHRGRSTGLVRQTVLEVIHYDPATRESVVISAWGERADWYRNTRAGRAIEVRIGSERYTPMYRCLGPEEAHARIVDYERRHPLLFPIFARVFDYPFGGSEEELWDFAKSIRMVAFGPQLPASS
jgi:deazaflavin-dependent oxidoreductase (nitroreductase family)